LPDSPPQSKAGSRKEKVMANRGPAGPRPGRRGAPSWEALKRRAAPTAATGSGASDPFAAAMAKGIELHRAGQLRDAGLLFQRIVDAAPQHAPALHALGLVVYEMGEGPSAAVYLERAVAAAPRQVAFLADLGLVLAATGRPDAAIETYRRALKLSPDAARLHLGLGVALFGTGKFAEAAQATRRALAREPKLTEAHAHLGRVLAALGEPAAALESFARAIEIEPAYPDAHVWLGDFEARHGHLEAAAASYRAAVAANPRHEAAHLGLASVLGAGGHHQAAADNYRAAAFLRGSAIAYAGLARELAALGEAADAADAARTALRLDPADAAVRAELEAIATGTADGPAPARALSDLEREEAQHRIAVAATPDNAEAHFRLATTLAAMGRLREAVAACRETLRLKPDHFAAWSALLFNINYLGDEPVAGMVTEAKAYGEAVAARIRPRTDHANDRDPNRPLRVGLISADLHNHPVGRFLEHPLAALDNGKVELFAYATGIYEDDMTERLKASIAHWRDVPDLDDDALERQIRADRIDILVDLSGHSGGNRLLLFARKPAPVAFTWLGYFATTGIGAIDYVLANRWVIPESEQNQWTETPWRMPDTYLCFSPPRLHVPLAPPPALKNGYVTFGSANNINKLSAETTACWAGVLEAVPESRLLLRSRPLSDAPVAEAVRRRFSERGVDPDRLMLQGAVDNYGEHLARYNDVDIALDPFPYAGGTTSVEALWMGVPVLTLRGDRYVAHMGESILHNIGMPDWIAADPADYAARAAAFASDLPGLAALRRGLRHRFVTSPLTDAPAFARYFEEALRGMWRKWCESGAVV
jgi:predicted O-linked N-acetylglucosamine transferase (SPINDLY family)